MNCSAFILIDPSEDAHEDLRRGLSNIESIPGSSYPIVVDRQMVARYCLEPVDCNSSFGCIDFKWVSFVVPFYDVDDRESVMHAACILAKSTHARVWVPKNSGDVRPSLRLPVKCDTFEDLCKDYCKRRYIEQPILHPAYADEGKALWECHVMQVVRWVKEVGPAISVDPYPATLAAYFHDIARLDGDDVEHHERSANIAATFLRILAAPMEITRSVSSAILNHRGSVSRDPACLDGRLLAAADGIATLEHYPVVLFSSFAKHRCGIFAGMARARNKFEKAWSKIPDELRPRFESKYRDLVCGVTSPEEL